MMADFEENPTDERNAKILGEGECCTRWEEMKQREQTLIIRTLITNLTQISAEVAMTLAELGRREKSSGSNDEARVDTS